MKIGEIEKDSILIVKVFSKMIKDGEEVRSPKSLDFPVKLQNVYQVRQEMISKSIIEKFGRIMVLLRLYGILLIQLCARLSIKMNARHTLFHAGHGKWLLYTAKRMAAFILL